MPTSRDDRIVEKGGFKYIRLKGGRLMSFFNAYAMENLSCPDCMGSGTRP